MKILRKKRVGANNNEYHAENLIQPFAHDLGRLKENGKLAFRKCFDHNKFRKMFKRNGLSTGKYMAIIPKWNNRFIDKRTEWLL